MRKLANLVFWVFVVPVCIVIFVAIVAAGLCGCSSDGAGEFAPCDGEYEQGCLLRLKPIDGGKSCTAVAIEPTIVLTAAHCIKNNTMYYRLENVEGEYVGRSVASHKHPNYTGKGHDIAVVVTAAPMGVPLADIGDPPELIGEKVVFAGYGRGHEPLAVGSAVVHGGEDGDYYADEGFDVVSCSGDSGAGVFWEGELVALNSRGPRWKDDNGVFCLPYNNIYTGVVAHIEWIETLALDKGVF